MRGPLTLLAACLVLGCAQTDSASDAPPNTSAVEREIRGFSLMETDQGRLVWELSADSAWRLPDSRETTLENVTMVFYEPDGRVRSRLTALRGYADEQSGDLRARDRVEVITVDGDTLNTEELNYDKLKDRITGPGYVRLAQPDRVLTGFEFEADPDLTDYKVHRDVHITIVDRGQDTEGL